jgi:hypothetical protein
MSSVCHSLSSLLCSVKSSNNGRSSAPGLTSSQAGGHLTPSSCSSNFLFRTLLIAVSHRYIISVRTAQKTLLPILLSLLRVTQRLPTNDCSFRTTVLALSKYVLTSQDSLTSATIFERLSMESLSGNRNNNNYSRTWK